MAYPFTKYSLWTGIVVGLIAGVLFRAPLAGFALLVLFLVIGLVWRRDEPPILSFALAFQWIFIVAGYLYTAAGGQLEDLLLGNVDLAIFLSLVGLLCIALGLRLGIALLSERLHRKFGTANEEAEGIDIRRLFWVTLIAYSASWMFEIVPMDIFFNAAQIIGSVLAVREVLFCLLLLTILRRREGYRLGGIIFIVAVLPRFISKQSTFKELIFMMLVVILSEFRPWVKSATQEIYHRRLGAAVAVLSLLLVIAGGAWEGGIKPVWRGLEVEGSPTEKLQTFMQVTEFVATEMESEGWLAALVSRVSSVTQFGLVLDRVPGAVPHENGRLLWRATKHILAPRLLFPGKENLGTDSWMAEEYAGLKIGEDTSVGIGYMAEFYVDWGAWGMMPCLFGLGLLLGLAYGFIYLASPSYAIARALVIVPFMANFITYEASLPKLLGGFIMNVMILLILARFIPSILQMRKSPAGEVQPAAAVAR
jgi:hypothetical protein